MMLSCGFITLMHAEDITTSNGTTEVTITKMTSSTYTVSIPKQFNLANDEMFYVEVIEDIAPTEVLKVSADSDIIMIKQGDDKYEESLSFSFGEYSWQSQSEKYRFLSTTSTFSFINTRSLPTSFTQDSKSRSIPLYHMAFKSVKM